MNLFEHYTIAGLEQELVQLNYSEVKYQDDDCHAVYFDAFCNSTQKYVEIKVEVEPASWCSEEQHEYNLQDRPVNTEDWNMVTTIESQPVFI